MIGFVAFGIALAGISWLVAGVSVSLGNKHQIKWWRLEPVSPDIDTSSVSLAAATLRRGRRAGTATILRKGAPAESSRLWLGIDGAANPERTAHALASAGGCKLGEAETPPSPDPQWQWWYSAPWIYPEDSEYLPEEGAAQFADHANRILDEDDYLIITARPSRDGRSIHAAALSTSPALASAWTHVPPPEVKRPRPHLAVYPAALAGLIGMVPFLFLPLSGAIARAPVGPLMGAVAMAAAAVAVLRSFRNSPVVRTIERGGSVALPSSSGLLSLLRKDNQKKVPAPLPIKLLAEWAAGGERTAVTAPKRLAPDEVTVQDGSRVGRDLMGRECWLADADRQWGVFAVGDPGTGKTTWLLNLLAADCKTVSAGAQRTIIWIETKGEGAKRAETVMRANGVQPLVLSSADIVGPRLEVVDWADPDRAANVLTEAMRYAFEHDDIREQSAQILVTALRAAVAAPAASCAQLDYPGRPNVMELCYWMLGGDPELGAQDRAEQALKDTPEFQQVLRYTKHMNKFDSARALEPARNKLQGLRAARGLWEAGLRPTASFADLIPGHSCVVLNLGPTEAGGAYSEQTAQRCAAMLMYLLWDSIKVQCDSWQSQGRSIAIYSDELADIAGFGDPALEVVRALADQGRSRGVLPVFATQRPGQIPPRTQEAVMSFGSRAYFRVEHHETAKNAAADLVDAYTDSELRSLPVGQCAARLRRDGVAQTAFTLCPDNL